MDFFNLKLSLLTAILCSSALILTDAATTDSGCSATSGSSNSSKDANFQSWKKQYWPQHYTTIALEQRAYEAFLKCRCYVDTTFKQRKQSQHLHFEVSATINCGLQDEQFRNGRLGGNYSPSSKGSQQLQADWTTQEPVIMAAAKSQASADSGDWQFQGKVSPVRDQGQCSSSWAFSAAGALESHLAILNNFVIPLSVQNLIDCSKDYGTKGCRGGSPDSAFEYVEASNGLNAWVDYRYTASDIANCRFHQVQAYAPLQSPYYIHVPKGDENALQQALAIGPVSVGIYASLDSFKLYGSGVYDDPDCRADLAANHAVLLTGWGVDTSNQNDPISYWTIKNSWGSSWGESGFARLKRGVNICGIANHAVYPVLNGEEDSPTQPPSTSNEGRSSSTDSSVPFRAFINEAVEASMDARSTSGSDTPTTTNTTTTTTANGQIIINQLQREILLASSHRLLPVTCWPIIIRAVIAQLNC